MATGPMIGSMHDSRRTRRGVIASALCAALLMALGAAPERTQGAAESTPSEISPSALLAQAYQNLYGHDFVQTLSISARFRGGREMTRRLQITRKQSSTPGRALVRFLEPGDIRGTAMLLIENKDRFDDIYLYLPSLGTVRHLAASQRADSFFGTDVSFEDLEPKMVEDVEVRSLGQGTSGAGGEPCSLVETRPRVSADSGYERAVSCIEPRRALILWSDLYRRGRVVKRIEVDAASVREIGASHIPFRARVIGHDRETETLLATESYESRADIPDSVFSVGTLELGSPEGDRTRSKPAN